MKWVDHIETDEDFPSEWGIIFSPQGLEKYKQQLSDVRNISWQVDDPVWPDRVLENMVWKARNGTDDRWEQIPKDPPLWEKIKQVSCVWTIVKDEKGNIQSIFVVPWKVFG